MKKRIFYSITGVTLVSICLFSVFIATIMYNQLFDQARANIKKESSQIKQVLTADNNYNINAFITANRITILDKDGNVLFDNLEDPETMDNHGERPEIVELEHNSQSESTRLSDTLGTQTYYYAVELTDGNILRLSISMDSIYSIIFKSMPYIAIITVFVIIFSMFISKYLTKRIISPLYNINERAYDELELFYKKIKNQQEYIENQKLELDKKTNEFNVITENVADGFIILNTNSEILSINQNAVKILGKKNTGYISKSILELNRSDKVIQSIQYACQGENSEIFLDIANKQYVLHIAPIYNNKLVVGIVILIVDNTEKADAEKIRSEFSANVSHELKTPLTSISGYAELIKTGLAKQKDIQTFAEKIYDEAQNLIILIQDIIKLSKLDERDIEHHKQIVNLKELLDNIILRLDIPAKQKGIEFNIQLDNIEIFGTKSVLDKAFSNVLENSIKYNVQNGKIDVRLSKSNEKTVICITDTGIGIPEDSLDRIFERFYRVDTSHSKNIPGTGLGMAIVKHAIQLHKGEIYVDSEVSKGTTVTMYL